MKIISRDLVCTKYVGPTNHRGSCVSVVQGNTRSAYAWDHALDVRENHAEAAFAFLRDKRADLEIELDNNEMSRPDHVAVALNHVARAVRRVDETGPDGMLGESGAIRDSNGNRVGAWQVVP